MDIVIQLLIDPGFAIGYIGEAINVAVDGVPL